MTKDVHLVTIDSMSRAAKVFFASIIGMVTGWDPMFEALVVFTLIDYATGVGKAVIRNQWESAIGARGIGRKAMMFAMVASFHYADIRMVDFFNMGPVKMGSIVAALYALNELGSIIENVSGAGVPVPGFVKRTLATIREKFEE